MKNYKMILRYDGGRYDGWQKQGNTENTIQQRLEEIISCLAGCKIEVFGSGRTDAGTHAWAQTANFHMCWTGSVDELKLAINEQLPEDIAVISLEEASDRFHSRLSAKAKTYEYTIWLGNEPPVFWRRYIFWCKKDLDTQKMEVAARVFVGSHDFKSFCANKRTKKSTVREIYDISFRYEGRRLVIAYHGNGFLYQMVRILTGTLIEVGEGKKEIRDMEAIILAKDREAAGFTAPAKGLMLKEVFYGEGPGL